MLRTYVSGRGWLIVLAALVAFCWTGNEARAQFSQKWLSIGEFQEKFEGSGRNGRGEGTQWPAIFDYSDNTRSDALWIAAKNFTDEKGNFYDVKIAHGGPLVTGVGEVFSQTLEVISRFEAPVVTVDGFESFDKPVVVDRVDPTMKGDRTVHHVANTVTGVTLDRKMTAFSQEHHDDYIVYDYTITNTGNVDEDAQIELPDQTLEGVYLWMFRRYRINHQGTTVQGGGPVWGRFNMSDIIGFGDDDFEPEFGPDLRGWFTWGGHNPGFTRWDNIGAPALDDRSSMMPRGDSLGRLTAAHMLGMVVAHADASPADRSDDRMQPRTLHHIDNDDKLILGNDHQNKAQMIEEYNRMVAAGHANPHHADLIVPPAPGLTWHERMARSTADPSLGVTIGGWSMTMGFGPYTLRPGESVRVVFAEGAGGLSRDASIKIGRAFKQAHLSGNPQAPIEYDADGDGAIEADERMSKNEWVMTSRDSLFQTFRRFHENYKSDFDIPQPPLPPSRFTVTSGTDRIEMEWDVYPGAAQEGFEIYRARNRYEGAVDDDYKYEKIATLGPNERFYEDTDVVRGISYYYYIQAVGPVNNDPTGLTPTGLPLRSGRYFTQTYDPAFLKREAGSALSDVRVVPNPYNLASDKNIRWPDQQDRIGFLNVPGECTIQIYTELGELVETIEHTDGSGDAYWNLTTSSRQVVVSGIYMAVIRDKNTGDQILRNFVIIR